MNIKVLDALVRRVETIEEQAGRLYNEQKDLRLKNWFDNQDVCQILNISKRTLQNYRERGLLPYCRIEHKILYKPEDVERLLERSHHSKK